MSSSRSEKPAKLSLYLLLVGALGCGLVGSEIVLRALVKPSAQSYGTLLGVELPPFSVLPRTSPQANTHPPDRGVRTDASVVAVPAGAITAPDRVAPDDLRGVLREDALLGYAPKEGTVSTNGWWPFNELGARARRETTRAIPPGTRRILVFGESFAAGSRVPLEGGWTAQLEAAHGNLEMVNLAVDGYGMGQSYLRYRVLKDRLEYDGVLLAFVPSADTWRDVNVIRYLGEGWPSYTVMPRFVLEHGELALIRSPYDPPTAIYAQNREGPGTVLRAHLDKYDAFYSSAVHEEPSWLGTLVISKLVASASYRRRIKRLREGMLAANSEAMQIERRIFMAMDAEIRTEGKFFVLVVLPTAYDLRRLRKDHAFAEQWQEMLGALQADRVPYIDVTDELSQRPANELDTGADGTHYGPHTNALIAARIARGLQPAGAPLNREPLSTPTGTDPAATDEASAVANVE